MKILLCLALVMYPIKQKTKAHSEPASTEDKEMWLPQEDKEQTQFYFAE